MQDEYSDRVRAAMLSMRGNDATEWEIAISHIQKKLKLAQNKLPREASVGLSHPDFYEFAFSKTKYLERAYMELSDRVMTDPSTPHYLVMFENDREYIRQIDDLFKSLATEASLRAPSFRYSSISSRTKCSMLLMDIIGLVSMREITKMSRVTIYRPGRVNGPTKSPKFWSWRWT